ncbi:MAG: DNA-binding protein [Armatimonadota bacterium]|nr:MAG: DNA-binding protein [Armatimonadota bacterium]
MKVFVDTVAWIALVNRDDNLHEPARQRLQSLFTERAQLVTTELVLIELANALAMPGRRSQAYQFVQSLRQLSMIQIVGMAEELLAEGWQLYGAREDKAWSLVDCVSFVVMQREGIREAFTADHHFRQAGFVTIF